MTKSLSIKKRISTLTMLVISFLFALIFLLTPTTAYALTVGSEQDVSSNFDLSIAGFTVLNDSDSDKTIDHAYTVTHSKNYNESKFGALPTSLSDKENGYALIKTPQTNAHPISAGLKSPTFELKKDSFYHISVDVNAKSDSTFGGAVVKLVSTDNKTIYLKNGNSEFITTDGWVKYSLYLATSQFENMDVAINLTLGNTDGAKCLGYAGFDNLNVQLIDYEGFESKLSSFKNDNLPQSYVEDLRKTTTLIEDFSSVEYEKDGEIIVTSESVDGPYLAKSSNKALKIINRTPDVSSYGVVKINENAPIEFSKVSSTQSGFYLVTVYTKGEDFEGTASITLNYKSSNSISGKYAQFPISPITDEANACHNGWKRNYFIVKSSVISDYVGYLSVEYGSSTSSCTGTILVDDIEITPISFADYGKYSSAITSSSVVCDFDSSLVDNTGINGTFYKLSSSYDKLRPDLWTVTQNNDGVDYELVSKESAGNHLYSSPAYEIDPNNPIGNVVKIASENETIFSLDSQPVDFSATDSISYYKVTVLAFGKDISGDGTATLSLVDTNGSAYGALKIKAGTSAPTLYTFSFKAKDSVSFYIRCSLGDTTFGKKSGGKGELYIARVSYSTITENEYITNVGEHYETINFYYNNFNDYTLYNKQDTNDVKDAGTRIASIENLSNGEARHGIVEIDEVNVAGHDMASTTISDGRNIDDLNPYKFGHEELKRTYGFVVTNSNAKLTIKQRQTMTRSTGENSEEISYYKVVVSARARVVGEYGLTIGIVNTSTGEVISQITNIKDTKIYYDQDENNSVKMDKFMDFEFFVKLNDADVSIQIVMTLGGLDKATQRTSGFVQFQGYQLSPSHESEYNKAVNNTKNGAFYFDNSTETYKYGATKDLSVKKETGKTTAQTTYNPNTTWYLVPSILFGVLIIVAVLGYFIKKIVKIIHDKKEKNAPANVDKSPAYTKRIDYSRVSQDGDDEKTDNSDVSNSDDNIDEFDEDYDMYAVHEIKAPEKKVEKSEQTAGNNEIINETADAPNDTSAENNGENEQQAQEEKVDSNPSDEFDD